MTTKNIGNVHGCNLSIPIVFCILKLSFNLLFVSQLYEIGYKIVLDLYSIVVGSLRPIRYM